MTGLIELATGTLDRRQITTTWLPLLGFLTGLGAIVVSAYGWVAALSWWDGLSGEAQAVLIATTLIVTVLAGQIVSARRISIIKLYEGYWSRFAGMREALRQRHLTAHHQLPGGVSTMYPLDAADVLPTRLGNILSAAERHADRYGLDSVTTWPRLYLVLPDQFKAAFATAATSLEAMAVISALGVVFAAAGGLAGAIMLPWYGTALCFWIGVLVGWLGYRGMLRAALPYASLVRAAFDVHRFELLTAMQLRLPTSYGTELRQWTQLSKLWTRGAPDSDRAADLRYPNGTDSSPAAPTPSPAPQRTPGQPTRVRQVLPVLLVVVGLLLPTLAAIRENTWLLVPNTGPLPHATRHLDAYHLITSNDLATNGTTASLDTVIGRYPLHPIKKDDPVHAKDLGPRLPTGALTDRTIVTVTLAHSTGLADRLARGQEITLTSTSSQRTDALVLELTGTDTVTLVVAVPTPAPDNLTTDDDLRVTPHP